MKSTELIMGMPITVEVVATNAAKDIQKVFDYFRYVDGTFSTYKPQSEISRINRRELDERQFSPDIKEVLALSEKTKRETKGYFDIVTPDGVYDPSGLVKGWAIYKAAQLLLTLGREDFYIEAGGDIQTNGKNTAGQPWSVGIRHPFEHTKVVKVLQLSGQGVATSGTYERGNHIYNPLQPGFKITTIVSLTVLGPNIYEADRFATAAFAMGPAGINFIEQQPGLEGYIINNEGLGTATSGFERYVTKV